VISRGFLLALLAAAACSRPAPAADKETQERAASLAVFERGFMTSCVDAVNKKLEARGLPADAEAGKTSCGCAWPRVREALLLSVRPITGIDEFNYNVRFRAVMAEHKKFLADFLRSDEGRGVLKDCAVLEPSAPALLK
jgi:hypothetical protein